ncbi:hypothetical protein TNCV_4347041 [Trichonephila clavipes]|nr:hypothetical protein TNCV_4347041 [Trichonephila clavipes]
MLGILDCVTGARTLILIRCNPAIRKLWGVIILRGRHERIEKSPYARRTTLSWRACPHHAVQQGWQCAGHLAKTRHGALTWSTPRIQYYSIRARIQRVNPPALICSTNPTVVSLRGHQREVPPAD